MELDANNRQSCPYMLRAGRDGKTRELRSRLTWSQHVLSVRNKLESSGSRRANCS